MIGKGPACVPDYLLIQATGWLIISLACIISRGLCHSRFRSNSKFHFTLIQSLMEWSLQIFAHATTALLLWHVQNFVVIWQSRIELWQSEFSLWVSRISIEMGRPWSHIAAIRKSGLNTGHKKYHLSIYSNHFAVLHVVLHEYYSCPIILKLCPIEQHHNKTVGAMC